jgi:hypothetical protein
LWDLRLWLRFTAYGCRYNSGPRNQGGAALGYVSAQCKGDDMKRKVYILCRCIDYEGYDAMRVYSDKGKANKVAKRLVRIKEAHRKLKKYIYGDDFIVVEVCENTREMP